MRSVQLLCIVLVLGQTGCTERNPRVVTTLNHQAALASLSEDPLQWRVVTTGINRQETTMYTLFGNDLAVDHARMSPQGEYPAGAVLALVTWKQQEDIRWFGGKIPGRPLSVEFVWVTAKPDQQPEYRYRIYEGTPLRSIATEEGAQPGRRANFLLLQRAAVMP